MMALQSYAKNLYIIPNINLGGSMSLKLTLVALSSFAFGLSSLQAEIWKTKKSWSPKAEKAYTKWFQSNAVNPKIFTSKTSKYYGINADCADAAYALRAIFALENDLPFKVINPTGSSSGKRYLDNETDFFDSAGNKYQRLVAMINYLSDVVGTEHLSFHDTYPVKISSVKPGTLYTYKIVGADGNFIRHTYNIKEVTRLGDFDLIYSTQTVAKENLDLVYKRSRMVTNAPLINNWGFKRFKWPENHHISNTSLHPYFEHSTEQYELAKSTDERAFFRHVTNILKKDNESAQSMITRKLRTACEESNERITYVNQGYQYQLKLNGQCLNYADFDAYSTPSRDKNLYSTFLDLKDAVDIVIKSGKENQVDFELMQMAYAVVYGTNEHSAEAADLKTYCPIRYKPGKALHLAELYRRVKSGLLSSHPNDSLEVRWGDSSEEKTSCKKWY
jgi:mRNA-degrading endonuclease HigB of HigAB toxin-antitoxin module